MLANRHCIIPAEYIHEWREEDGEKQPCLFARQDGKPLMLVGIGIGPKSKENEVPSFAILTDEPNESVSPCHDRMPVAVIDPEKWLDLDSLTLPPSFIQS